jgi:multicomponent Na+:H+ antiporter subunit F
MMTTHSDLLSLTFSLSGLMLLAASFILLLRLWRGPSITDRIIALDLYAMIFSGAVIIYSIYSGEAVYLNVIVVLALVVFLSTVAFARLLEKRGRS